MDIGLLSVNMNVYSTKRIAEENITNDFHVVVPRRIFSGQQSARLFKKP